MNTSASRTVFLRRLILVCCTALAACKQVPSPTGEQERRAAQEQLQSLRAWADALSADLTYFKDRRTDMCFAYSYPHPAAGTAAQSETGASLSEVECAKVLSLLVNLDPPSAVDTDDPVTQMHRQTLRKWADDLSSSLTYFRDYRSGLCYAHAYVLSGKSSGTGNSAVTKVGCDKASSLVVNPERKILSAPLEAPPPAPSIIVLPETAPAAQPAP